MKRVLFSPFLLCLLVVSSVSPGHAARLAGAPLAPSLQLRGPVQHAWVGASLVDPVGTVLASSAASVEVPANALLFQAHLFWLGSGENADTSVDLRRPDGTLITVDVPAENCFHVGSGAAPNAIRYWQCSANISETFPALDPFGGEYRLEGLTADTGAPYRAAQAFAGAFGLLLVYTDASQPAPRMLQVSQGLLYARHALSMATHPLSAVDTAGQNGRFSFLALEGDVELPADGACDGELQSNDCDLMALCVGNCVSAAGTLDESTLALHFTNADNPFGNVFNETYSSDAYELPNLQETHTNALDLDVFDIGTRLSQGRYEYLQPVVRTGQDAIVLAVVVLEVDETDSDGDGLSDLHESRELHTRPDEVDSDQDGLSDGLEHLAYLRKGRRAQGTNPLLADSDGDGLCDGAIAVPGVCDAGEDMNGNGDQDPNETNPNETDSDGDGLTDDRERGLPGAFVQADGGVAASNFSVPASSGSEFLSDPTRADTDGDGLLDGQEDINRNGRFDPGANETDPTAVDSDLGGLSDYDERMGGRNPNFAGDDGVIVDDEDEDGLTFNEENAAGSNPNRRDTDADGLHDGLEVRGPQPTDPTNPDSDQDGIADGFEDRNRNGIRDPGESDPNRRDTDLDGLADGLEDLNGDGVVSPGETAATDPDSDNDGLCDGPASVPPHCVGGEDMNANGQVDPGETSPRLHDSDGDGLPDGMEKSLGQYRSADGPFERTLPTAIDTDGDGLSDGLEDINRNGLREAHETDPTAADTDRDGMADGEEWRTGRNPLVPDGPDFHADAGDEADAGVPTDAHTPRTDSGPAGDAGAPPPPDAGDSDAGLLPDSGPSVLAPDAGTPLFPEDATFSGATFGNCQQSGASDVGGAALWLALFLGMGRKRFSIFSNASERSNV